VALVFCKNFLPEMQAVIVSQIISAFDDFLVILCDYYDTLRFLQDVIGASYLFVK